MKRLIPVIAVVTLVSACGKKESKTEQLEANEPNTVSEDLIPEEEVQTAPEEEQTPPAQPQQPKPEPEIVEKTVIEKVVEIKVVETEKIVEVEVEVDQQVKDGCQVTFTDIHPNMYNRYSDLQSNTTCIKDARIVRVTTTYHKGIQEFVHANSDYEWQQVTVGNRTGYCYRSISTFTEAYNGDENITTTEYDKNCERI